MGREIQIETRPLTQNDAAWLADWERERPYPWTAAHFLETMTGASRTWIFEESGEPVGFAVLQNVGTEAYLLNVMVKKEKRRGGVGKAVMENVLRRALDAGARYLVLDVDPANAAAVALYNKTGFEIVERRARSYPRGEDALIMRKHL